VRHDRHFSLLRRLFPEQHVYVRSGPRSRYVVLTWPWQAGVSLALAAVAVWAGLASFGWLATHLETLDQRRELARVAQANQRLEALAAVYRTEEARATDGIRSLVAELEGVEAGRARDIGLPATAEAEAAWPEAVAERLLPAAMQMNESGSGRDWLYDRITRDRIDSTRAAETIRLRAELLSARAEIARLESALRHEAGPLSRADGGRLFAPPAVAGVPGAGSRPGIRTWPTLQPAPCAAARPAPC
jgi:hypothetical protein